MGLENGIIKTFEEKIKKLANITKLPQLTEINITVVKQLLKNYHAIFKKGKNTKKRVFGNSLIGAWYCPKCSYQIFPNKLKELEDSFIWSNGSKSVSEAFVGPHCKKCNIPMEYDEFE